MGKSPPPGTTTPSNSRMRPLRLALTILLTTLLLCILTTLPHNLLPSPLSHFSSPSAACTYPVVYNKPPKTASSFIQTVILNWSATVGRNAYKCTQTPTLTSIVLPDCMPEAGDACGVFTGHIFLTKHARSVMADRLPGYKFVTSTRYPAHRIISFYLFTRNIRHGDANWTRGLPYYLNTYNPWRLYNYHTGEGREGDCPLTEQEQREVVSLAATFDIVIDVNAIEESNAILKHYGLFQLPRVVVKDREKERGTSRVVLPDDMVALLKTKTCVEEELHRALQIRMASLYQKVTGKPCFEQGHLGKIDNCIMRRERDALKDSWLF